jgi:hypothetical protein
MYLLVYYIMPSADPSENLQALSSHIFRYFRTHNFQNHYKYLNKLTMISKKDGYPKLRGKAAEVKSLGPALLSAWKHWQNPNVDMHKKNGIMLKLNVQMEAIIDEHKHAFSLPAEAAASFRDAGFSMFKLQNNVAKHYLGDAEAKLFCVTTKSHMVMHAIDFAEYINPRLVWCFAGEDLMQHQRRLAQASVKGNKSDNALLKLAIKNKYAAHFRCAADED